MPGFLAFPEIRILTSRISFKLINASVPIKTDVILDFSIDDASSKVNPATFTSPTSGRFIEPFRFTGEVLIWFTCPIIWILKTSPTSSVYD